MDAISERRRRAKDAYDDATPEDNPFSRAIETATQVEITPEAIAAMNPAVGNREERLRAALAALGFEVIEP